MSKSQASHILLTRRNPVCETFAIAEGIQLGSKVGRVADSAAMPYNNELNHNESTKYTICYRLRLSKKEDLKKETHRRPFVLCSIAITIVYTDLHVEIYCIMTYYLKKQKQKQIEWCRNDSL